ncbi:MAG: zinc ABC transporter solute-binding protein [Bdellovibrionaceae bacterium]|nr:zinc ABC transporter solute-binding protein [Pseudobdellovibrionaceae bacterium]
MKSNPHPFHVSFLFDLDDHGGLGLGVPWKLRDQSHFFSNAYFFALSADAWEIRGEEFVLKFWIVLLALFVQTSAFAKDKVVTTFSVLEDIVLHLSDDEIEVVNLVPGGTDPHLFEPGPRELNKVREAKILFANGLHFEPWLDHLVKASPDGLIVVYASRDVKPRTLGEHGLHIEDPHAWNSPKELVSYIQVVADELAKAFPKEAVDVRRRAKDFIAKIESIHTHFAKKFEQTPESKRVLLTTHDAAGYLAKAYSIRTISPIGLSTSEDFKTADLSRLLADINRYKVKMIFTEPSHHKVLSERLAAKAKLRLGAELYLDGLSAKGGPADTVEKMLNHNLESILVSMER